MRIAAGELRGMGLKVPPHIRATEGKARQALFNILGERIVGARVVDGFAGSGALGLEAISRGASLVLFLEADPVCVKTIQANLSRIDPEQVSGRWDVLVGDALRGLRISAERFGPFEVVILDPPYDGAWGKKSLNVVADCAMLAPAGILCIEHALRNEPPAESGSLKLMKQHRYGGTVLSFYCGAPR